MFIVRPTVTGYGDLPLGSVISGSVLSKYLIPRDRVKLKGPFAYLHSFIATITFSEGGKDVPVEITYVGK